MQELGAEVVDNVTISDVIERLNRDLRRKRIRDRARVTYLRSHPNAPVDHCATKILLSGLVVPARACTLMATLGKSSDHSGYAQLLRDQDDLRQLVFTLMADLRVDVLVYVDVRSPSRNHRRRCHDSRTVVPDTAGFGNNRRLSPVLGFPAIAVPARIHSAISPSASNSWRGRLGSRTFSRTAYAFEQGTHHRRHPPLTPALTRLLRRMRCVHRGG